MKKKYASLLIAARCCSHQGAPLEGFNLTCPWHYAVVDVCNGKVSDRTVWAKNQTSYPVNFDESTGDIFGKRRRRNKTEGR